MASNCTALVIGADDAILFLDSIPVRLNIAL